MKKWFLVMAIIAALALGCVYQLIPASLTIINITPIDCTINGIFRNISTEEKWKQWWPMNNSVHDGLTYDGCQYQVTRTLLNTIEVQIQNDGLRVNSTINL